MADTSSRPTRSGPSPAAALTALEWGRRRRAAAAGADEVPLSWMDPEGPAL